MAVSETKMLQYLNDISENLVKEIYDAIAYTGFNRDVIINELEAKKATAEIVATISLIGSVRGGKKESLKDLKIKKEVATFISSYIQDHRIKGNPKSLTILRITACFPHVAAYMMLKAGVPKKISTSELPAFLQFPAAGSLPLKSEYRELHKQFCIDFSKVIKGEFNESIYSSMSSNTIMSAACPGVLHEYLV